MSADLGKTIFGPDDLRQQVDQELATIPAGHHGALVGWYTLDGRWRVSVAARVGDHWEFGTTFERDRAAGNVTGGVFVRGSW